MARLIKPLSDKEIKSAKVKEKEYKLSDGQSLFLVVKTNGTKVFRFDFSYAGKRKSMSFGVYPNVSLKEAREKREEARALLAKNINPVTVKRAKKISETLTLQVVIDEWLEIKKRYSSEATITQNRNILKNLTDWLGEVPIKDIRRLDIIDVIDRVQSRGVIETAHRLLSLINKIYKFAVTKEYIEYNIITDIDKSLVLVKNPQNHHPALIEPKEIKQLLIDINSIGERLKSDISTIFIFKLIPYVFVRSENIRLMCWDELDLENGIWAIPKEKMKMKIDFVCPLSTQAIKILKEIEPYSRHRSRFVFPSSKKDRGVSSATLSDTLNRLGYQNRHSFHGFRSMFSTTAYQLYKEHGFNSDIIESCLAHKERNRVKAAYNRETKYKYFDEKKELMQWWADWLDKLVK